MSGKLRLLFWIGILIMFVPYLGVTSGIRTGFTIILGMLIIWITIRLKHNYKELRFRLRRLEEPMATPDVSSDAQ